MKDVAPVALGIPCPLLGAVDAWRGKMPLELGGDELGSLAPVGAPAHRRADRGRETIESSLRGRREVRLSRRLRVLRDGH
jgi:hypothetical protein